MALISLSFVVADIPTVLTYFNEMKVYRSVSGINGPYVEQTNAGTRLPLSSNQYVYNYDDPAGDPTYYYQSSYYNSLTTTESSRSDAQLGNGDAALNVISVLDLKTNYLIGLDMTTPQGIPFPDSLYQYYIRTAVAYVAKKLDIPIITTVVTNERHDYYRDEAPWRFMLTQLNYSPIIAVQAVRLMAPGDQLLATIDPSWINIDNDNGDLEVIPGNTYASSIAGTTYAGFALRNYANQRRIPGLIRVDYTAGFANGVPDDIVELCAQLASYGPLNIAGDLLGGAGIASSSLSFDGLSQSINTTSSPMFAGYGARLNQYQQQVKQKFIDLRSYYKGIQIRSA